MASFRNGIYQPQLLDDNEWHYDCIDIKAQADINFVMDTGDLYFNALIWYDGRKDNQFWIDQFIISNKLVPPSMYQKPVRVPIPLFAIKISGIQPVKTFTNGLDLNDMDAVLETTNSGLMIQNIQEIYFTKLDIICFANGIVEQVREDYWNRYIYKWSTTHECSPQKNMVLPANNRRIHSMMMANGSPMRFDTYSHLLIGQRESGAYETKWGSLSGLHWRTEHFEAESTVAPAPTYKNGAFRYPSTPNGTDSHKHAQLIWKYNWRYYDGTVYTDEYAGDWVAPSQYVVPQSTLCVIEGVLGFDVNVAKNKESLMVTKNNCRPETPMPNLRAA